ncbi:glycosyltransferase family 4 protein [Bacteriovoracaceae bacterium]|nr:glycosyltransferase family 4 protein [Bacteriovoracaceae bacterium]
MNKFYIKVDDIKWVQNEKFGIIANSIRDKCEVQIISDSFKWRRYLGDSFYLPCLMASWRQVLVKDQWKKLKLNGFIASVSSHYNIGGGLNPISTIGKNDDLEKSFASAIQILKKFGGVLVNSKRLEELLKPHLSNITYIPNGVDHTFFTPKENKNYNPKKIKIGWVGKVKGAKNYELVEALKIYFQEQDIDFQEIAVSKGSQNILGREEMKNFYQNLDFYLCTSWHEGTPNPCLEAASCGTPLITTQVGNMPELVKNKVNSYFIDPTLESVKKVIQEIKMLNEAEYLMLSKLIREEISKHWTWDSRAKEFEKLFINFLKERETNGSK